MSSLNADGHTANKRDAVRSAWSQLRARLDSASNRIQRDIESYPTPIAGCDQHFNWLLEQRNGVYEEYRQLNEAERRSLVSDDPLQVLDDFVRTAVHIDDDARNSIRLSMAQALSQLED